MSDPLWQRILVAATGPVVTAVLARLVVNLVTTWAQRRRDEGEIREGLASELTEVANSLYLVLQAFWRAARDVPLAERVTSEALVERRGELDKTYHNVRTKGQVLERRLQIYYADREPAKAWHAVTDLLTVRYFLLLEADADRRRRIRRLNAGPDHSGLTEDQLNNPKLLLETYRSALDDCVQALWQYRPDRQGRHLKRGRIPPTWHGSGAREQEDQASEANV
jgi:hypothetical protein